MNDKSISRKEQQRILKNQTPEQLLNSLERESKNLLELDPEYGTRYFIASFRRKRNRATQRTAPTAE